MWNMALAFITFAGITGDSADFELDIGSNRFYTYKIGKKITTLNGLKVVDERVYESPFLPGPDLQVVGYKFPVQIPIRLFSNQAPYVQIFSYYDKNKKSPAVSNIVHVYPLLNIGDDLFLEKSLSGDCMEAQKFQKSVFWQNGCQNTCRVCSFSFMEDSKGYDRFREHIIKAARIISPSTPTQLNHPAGEQYRHSDNNDFIVRLIASIQSTTQKGDRERFIPLYPPHSLSKFCSYSKRPPGFVKNYYTPVKKLNYYPDLGFMGNVNQGSPLMSSDARIQIFTQILMTYPRFIQMFADNPDKLVHVLEEVIGKKYFSYPTQSTNQKSGVLTGNSRIPGSPFEQFVWKIGSALVYKDRTFAFSHSMNQPGSSIVIEKGSFVSVNGKPKFVYSGKESILFSVHLNINSGLEKEKRTRVIIYLVIKEPIQNEAILQKKYFRKDVVEKSEWELDLTPQEISKLPKNRDLLVVLRFSYLGPGNTVIEGGTDTYPVFIANEYFFKSIGSKVGDPIPLTNRNKYRNFWNKIWEGGGITKKRWKIEVNTKYYIYFRYDLSTNGRVETRIMQAQQDPDSDREMTIEGMMKSGLEVSPDELNNLMLVLGKGSFLEDARLNCLKTDEMSGDYNSEAQTFIKLKGKAHETGIIWAYPEICLYECILYKIDEITSSGLVTRVSEEKVLFPKLVSIHFVGEKTENSASFIDEKPESAKSGSDNIKTENMVQSSKIQGYKQIFDIIVELRPVCLSPIMNQE